jgi:hypothetical protein
VSIPRAPKGLEVAGRRLWRGTFEEREDGSRLVLRADELALLEEACRMADDVARIRAELDGAPLVVAGSKGQDVAHPLRGELHRTVGTLDRLLRTLALPDDDGGTSREWAGRRLARARWTG